MKIKRAKVLIAGVLSSLVLSIGTCSMAIADSSAPSDNVTYTPPSDTQIADDMLTNNQDGTSDDILSTDSESTDQSIDITQPESLQEILSQIEIDPSSDSNYKSAAAFMTKNQTKGIKVFVDGKMIDFSKYNNVEPLIDNGRTLLPLRAVAESIGADVNWQDSKQQITLDFANINMNLKVNSTTAQINNTASTLEVPPKIISGRTLVPLRFVGEGFSKKVGWLPYSNDLKIIYIY